MNNIAMVTDRADGNTYYNYSDLNRVEAKTAEVAELLTAQGYVTTVDVKTDWSMTDFPIQTEMNRYLGNVKKCVNNFCQMPGVTLPYTMDRLDYIGANNIEKTLVGIEKLLEYMLAVMRYSGTFYSGNEGLRGGYCL